MIIDNLLNHLLRLNSSIKSINKQPIMNSHNAIVGWNCYFVNNKGQSFAGGTAQNEHLALQIAVAESFERTIFSILFSKELYVKNYLLDEIPSTSGFAVGFTKESTAFRSICEAVERWSWSQWIDYGFKTPLLKKSNFSKLATHLTTLFDGYELYQKTVHLDSELICEPLIFSVFLGFKNNGIFAGSRVTTIKDDPWDHAAIEAYRNLKNSELIDSTLLDAENIISQRVLYFSKNKNTAIEQINRALITEWKHAKILLHKEVPTDISGVYMYRTICKDFKYWHLGGVDRFVY